jgi:hypothetical protein
MDKSLIEMQPLTSTASLLALTAVLTERKVRFPLFEDVRSKLLQVRSWFEALSRNEDGVIGVKQL